MNLIICLIEPKIPPNTGTIARLCAANSCTLHLVGDLGFSLDDKQLKRAGMDYWNHVDWTHFPDTETYLSGLDPSKIHLFTSKVERSYTSVSYEAGDVLIFGSETSGLDESILNRFSDRCCTIPMLNPNEEIRCLNLANAVSIGMYEAFRQWGKI